MKNFIAEAWFPILLVALIVFGVHSCETSEWKREFDANVKARESAERVPRLFSEGGGCKVYVFTEAGRDHYFTECPGKQVTTDASYSESCGKNCTRNKIETIATQPK
jgi:hypothetical protein